MSVLLVCFLSTEGGHNHRDNLKQPYILNEAFLLNDDGCYIPQILIDKTYWLTIIPIDAHHVLPGVPFYSSVSISIPITKRCSTVRCGAPSFPPPVSASTPTAVSHTPAK